MTAVMLVGQLVVSYLQDLRRAVGDGQDHADVLEPARQSKGI